MDKFRDNDGKPQKLVFTYTITRNGKTIRRPNGRPFAFWVDIDD